MIHVGRYLLKLLGLVAVGLVEKVLGLPMVVVMLTVLVGVKLSSPWRAGVFLVMGAMMAGLFFWPAGVGVGLVWLAYFWFRFGSTVLSSHHLRIMTAGLLGLLAEAIFSPNFISIRQLLYMVVVLLISLAWFKRRRWSRLAPDL